MKKKSIKNWKILNRIKFKLIEIMTINGEIYNFRKTAKKMAKEQTDEEFKRKFEVDKSKKGDFLHQSKDEEENEFRLWIKMNCQKDYNDRVGFLYNHFLNEMRRMWYFKNIDKLIPQEDKS